MTAQPLDLTHFLDQLRLQPFATMLCADEAFTLGEAREVYPALRERWAAQLDAEGIQVVADAIECYWNPSGPMESEHAKHGHIAMKVYGVRK